MDEKLVDKEYLLEKLPGKYGWTYTIIPEIRPGPVQLGESTRNN